MGIQGIEEYQIMHLGITFAHQFNSKFSIGKRLHLVQYLIQNYESEKSIGLDIGFTYS